MKYDKLAPESEVLLRCAFQHMSAHDVERVIQLCNAKDFGWSQLQQAAKFHKVSPIVLTNIQKCGNVAALMPLEVKQRWTAIKLRWLLFKESIHRKTLEIVQLLTSRSSKVMLLKGAALDILVYEQPWYIESADTDLLVDTPRSALTIEDREKLIEILFDTPLELEFARHHDIDMNRVFDIDYDRIWAGAIGITFRDQRVYVMSTEDILVVACINLCRKRFFQLKGVLGICELLRKFPTVNWKRVAENAKGCGADRIVYTSLVLAQRLFDCEIPAEALDAFQVSFPRRMIINRHIAFAVKKLVAMPPNRNLFGSVINSWVLIAASYRLVNFVREARVKRH